ncbi:MAG: hypothetical protein KGY99_05075 [Phycisphaerae bacterium]|nr:hypothetical protein [Phycisphaerae bacterium]
MSREPSGETERRDVRSTPRASSLRGLWRRHGAVACGLAAATVALQLAAYAAIASAVPNRNAVLGCLACALVWVALAAAPAAASAPTPLGALLRGGMPADASAVTLLVLWIHSPHVTFLAAVKIYGILAAMALVGVAAARLGRSAPARAVAATTAAVTMIAMLSAPFWVGGLTRAGNRETGQTVAAGVVRVNAFYGVTAAVYEPMRQSWNEMPMMYDHGQIQHHTLPPATWYDPVIVHGLLAGACAATALLRRRRDDHAVGDAWRHR